MPSPHEQETQDITPEKKLSWWWSRDEERYQGPCHSKADAIMDAWSDDPDQGAHICQAVSGEWSTDIIDDDRLAEAFDDANEESCDPDGDPPSAIMDAPEWKALADRLNRIIRTEIGRHGLAAWALTHQTAGEWIDIPTAWSAAQQAALSVKESVDD